MSEQDIGRPSSAYSGGLHGADDSRRETRDFRDNMKALGCPVNHLTDDEIIVGVVTAGSAASSFGLRVHEAADRLVRFAKAVGAV